MHIGVLTIKISLPGCSSLKEKRKRMGGVHERFGRNPAVAVLESADRNRLESGEWAFVIIATTVQEVDTLFSEIEDKLQRTIDGRMIDVHRQLL